MPSSGWKAWCQALNPALPRSWEDSCYHQWKAIQFLQNTPWWYRSGQQSLSSEHNQLCSRQKPSHLPDEALPWAVRPPSASLKMNLWQKCCDLFGSLGTQKATSIGNWIKIRMKLHKHFLAVWRIPISERFALTTDLRQPPLRTAKQPCMKWEHFLWKDAPAGFLAWTWITVFTALIKHVNTKLCCRNWLC